MNPKFAGTLFGGTVWTLINPVPTRHATSSSSYLFRFIYSGYQKGHKSPLNCPPKKTAKRKL